MIKGDYGDGYDDPTKDHHIAVSPWTSWEKEVVLPVLQRGERYVIGPSFKAITNHRSPLLGLAWWCLGDSGSGSSSGGNDDHHNEPHHLLHICCPSIFFLINYPGGPRRASSSPWT